MNKVFLSLSSGEVVAWLTAVESNGGKAGKRVTGGGKLGKEK